MPSLALRTPLRKQDRRDAETLASIGVRLARQGQHHRSIAFHRAALARCPANAEYAYNLGSALQACGRAEEAAAYLEQALCIDPRSLAALRLHAEICLDGLNRPQTAFESYRRAIELAPADISNYRDAARCFITRHDDREAIRLMRSGLPSSDDLNLTRGVALALADVGRYGEAIALLHEIISRAPEDYLCMRRLGEVYTALHDIQTAEFWLERGLRANPADRDAFVANLLHWLQLGDFDRARSLYRLGGRRVVKTDNWLHEDACLWEGQDCTGKTLRLVVGDIYFGDALQFVRFARLAKAAGATVIVECPRRLRSLLRTVPGVDDVVAFGNPFPPYDYQAPAFWLLFALPVPIDKLAGATPYLEVPAGLRSEWRKRIPAAGGINVGIVWAGSRYRQREPHGCRSMPLEELRPLAAMPGIHLYSLQCGPGRHELTEADQPFPAADLAPDFPNTAAAILALDLVVTIDTSIAHLAGALGRPVYVMLPYDACFRWMLDRDDTPWYSSMRLFRQTEPGQWSHPVAAVAAAISNLSAERSTR